MIRTDPYLLVLVPRRGWKTKISFINLRRHQITVLAAAFVLYIRDERILSYIDEVVGKAKKKSEGEDI